MQLINKIKKSMTKQRFAFICLFGLLVTFNGFVFNHFDLMANNQSDFGISMSEIAWLFVLIALLIWAIVVAGLSLIFYKSKKAFNYTCAVLLGVVLASYAQVLFMNKTELMGVGGAMARETVGQYIVNILIYATLIALPIVAVYLENKKGKEFTPKLALMLSIIILGMQTVGVISATAAAPAIVEDNELYYFSIEKQFELSKNDNVIVFVLDRMDCEYVDEIFTRFPETVDVFDGFTYYKNNISEYPGTFPSVTALLTDNHFDNSTKSQVEYLQHAWQNSVMIDTLHQKQFSVNALLDSTSTFYDFMDLDGKIDNIQKLDRKNRRVRGLSFYFAIQRLAWMRQSLDLTKIMFFNPRYLDIANYCIKVKNTPDYFPRTISANADLVFYNKLIESGGGLSADREEGAFSFVHLQAAHNPFFYDHNLKHKRENIFHSMHGKAIAQAHGTIRILNEYFNQMKALGIFEDATIVILGDHGVWGDVSSNPPTTALLVKQSGEGGEGLKTDHTSELSHGNFGASILEALGENGKKGDKKSYNDIISSGGVQERLFYNLRWTNLNSCTYINTYKINGNANDPLNWVVV